MSIMTSIAKIKFQNKQANKIVELKIKNKILRM